MTIFPLGSSPRRLAELDEARDLLTDILVKDGLCIAVFKFGPVAFPGELEQELRGLVGKQCAVLRLDGYHVRAV